jgi:hypothetical protein
MAGQASETAISVLRYKTRRPLDAMAGKGWIQLVITNLKDAQRYLEGAHDPQFNDFIRYLSNLISFYQEKLKQLNILNKEKIAQDIYDHQGYLLAADPYIGMMGN